MSGPHRPSWTGYSNSCRASRMDRLEAAYARKQVAAQDYHLARMFARHSDLSENAMLAVAFLSSLRGQRHVCASLQTLSNLIRRSNLGNPTPATLRRELSAARDVVGQGRDSTPLVLDGDRLYLRRFYEAEKFVAQDLLQRASYTKSLALEMQALVKESLEASSLGPRQRWAVVCALVKRLCVITGGPGTGKTFVVGNIVGLYKKLYPDAQVALCAPTGKAAARLRDSVAQHCRGLPLQEAFTVHRLVAESHDDWLPHDLVVVDEVSMADLELLATLLGVLRSDSRLILVGDKDQLASVGPGGVFADICSGAPAVPTAGPSLARAAQGLCGLPDALVTREVEGTLAECVVRLETNYRFGAHSQISRICDLLCTEEERASTSTASQLLGLLDEKGIVDFVRMTRPTLDEVISRAARHYGEVAGAKTPAEAFEKLEKFRLLCALRESGLGADSLNLRIRQEVEARLEPRFVPIMVTVNSHYLGLYNGDVGMVDWSDSDDPIVHFPAGQGYEKVRTFPLSVVPRHELAYALTVHKAQGSEFDHVDVLLPPRPLPLVTRELLYTAITRARHSVRLFATEQSLRAAAETREQRESGLASRLWQVDG